MSWIWIGPPAVIAIGAWAASTMVRRIEHIARDIDAAEVALNTQRQASSGVATDLRAAAARLPETRR